ncbi:MAG: RNA-binding protein [Candidatus Omnitrophica bacterium]|nr:RNA-binding protein [Candidatus Omnitrophota bacterium]
MEEEKKIYIGNLPYTLTEEDVKNLIEEKGINVLEVKLISDKNTGRAKGFGFAEFETKELAQQAVDILNDLEVSGRQLKVNKAKKMAPRSDNRRSSFGNNSGGDYRKRFER